MNALPSKYAFLTGEPGPLMLHEALKLFGTLETPGTADNPQILAWADEVAAACPSPYNDWAADFYNDDGIPWCGLAMAVVATRAAQGRPERFPPNRYLAALSWASYGQTVAKDMAALGDVLVFVRDGGGHVSMYVGEDQTHFHILGGNQADAFNIIRLEKSKLYAVRRPVYRFQPLNVRKIMMTASGPTGASLA